MKNRSHDASVEEAAEHGPGAATLQIAWIDTTADGPGDTADVTIWDPVEHRIEVFHADTGIPTSANRTDIIDRATELLQMAGYVVHSVEPHAFGYAAIVEKSPG
jgi:hypothetical protein